MHYLSGYGGFRAGLAELILMKHIVEQRVYEGNNVSIVYQLARIDERSLYYRLVGRLLADRCQ